MRMPASRHLLPYLGSFALHALVVVAIFLSAALQPRAMGVAPMVMRPLIEATLVTAPLVDPASAAADRLAATRAVEERRLEIRRREAERIKLREAARKETLRKEKLREQVARNEEAVRKTLERRETQRRELELQRALVDEEQRAATASLRARLASQWAAAIQGRVQRAWIRPPSARSGLDCIVAVTQAPGGMVVNVEVRQCNGDQAVRQSIEAAVLRSSPLPPPPDSAIFERQLELRFRPND